MAETLEVAQAQKDLKAQGISDETLAQAKALGLSFGGLLGLLLKYGPMAKGLIAELLALLNQPSTAPMPPKP